MGRKTTRKITFSKIVAYTLIGDDMSKETFKSFVSRNPSLASYVNKGEMTWQRFYEMYDLYGENGAVWKKYKEEENTSTVTTSSTLLGDTSLKEIFNTLKKVDLETVRRGVDGLSKAVNLLQDFSSNKSTNNNPSSYERRPMYRYFED